jgi:mannose-6-phosphate isomerase-like protein (cupin superfamily)
MPNFVSKLAKAEMDYEAPDKSEVRLLTEVSGSSMALGTLGPQMISDAKVHKTVDEQWYFVQGIGQVWLKDR